MTLDYVQMKEKSEEFNEKLSSIKSQKQPFHYYPFGIMNNFTHLETLLNMGNQNIFDRLESKQILDLGCADGDLGYFMESIGYDVDLMDCSSTNYNKMQGVRKLKEVLNSNATISDCDIDSQFQLSREKYGIIFFLGILYHLKNPFYVLEQLSKVSRFMFLSTRIAKFSPDKTPIQNISAAYLIGHGESENGDLTNYFIFSEKGLQTLLDRSRWQVMNFMTVGDQNSDPISDEHDERAFVLCESLQYNN